MRIIIIIVIIIIIIIIIYPLRRLAEGDDNKQHIIVTLY